MYRGIIVHTIDHLCSCKLIILYIPDEFSIYTLTTNCTYPQWYFYPKMCNLTQQSTNDFSRSNRPILLKEIV